MQFTPKKSAYSLVFAFVLMTGIMLVASSTVEKTQEKILFFRDLEGATQARLAADSALELGRSAVKSLELGTEISLEDTAFCTRRFESQERDFVEDCEKVEISYEVIAQGKKNPLADQQDADIHYIPIPSTGDAVPSRDLCPDPFFGDAEALADPSTRFKDPSHSCNWNKIQFGEVVILPIYTLDEDGLPLNPFADADAEWWLKLRTPCKNGSLEGDCSGGDPGEEEERYMLDEVENDGRITAGADRTDSVLVWEIVGVKEDGTSESLRVNTAAAQDQFFRNERSLTTNSEVTEKKVNLYSSDSSAVGLIYSIALKTPNVEDFLENAEYTRFFLKMQLAQPLKDDFTQSISFLELQMGSDFPSISPVQHLDDLAAYRGSRDFSYRKSELFSIFDNPFTGFTLAD